MFENVELGIPCPGCGHKTPKSIGFIRANSVLVCAGCNEVVTVKGDELIAGLDKADRSIADLRNKLGGRKRTNKIKF